jgi:hypothetical protein
MATTTPNYGWSVPTSTDLVKDGATAIETLGDSVDATVKALNPSTTLGDIEYRSATANTNTRLAVGTTGQVLTVAAGVPSWATPASPTPTFQGCVLSRSADLSVPNNTETTVTWDTETFDVGGYHSTSSNTSRITIPSGKGGYYLITGFVGLFENPTQANSSSLRVKKNGTLVYQLQETAQLQKEMSFSFIVSLAATDYVEMFAFQNTGGTSTFYSGVFSSFGATFLGA